MGGLAAQRLSGLQGLSPDGQDQILVVRPDGVLSHSRWSIGCDQGDGRQEPDEHREQAAVVVRRLL